MSSIPLNLSPDKALEQLVEGNTRFAQGLRSIEPLVASLKLKELATKGQMPFATILTCSDSRVPAEAVFDRGVGDLFVIRMAGNIVTPMALASIEFAALNFGTSLVVIMGHTQCGAIKAAVQTEKTGERAPSANLDQLISRIRPAVRHAMGPHRAQTDQAKLIQDSTLSNVELGMRKVTRQSPVLTKLVSEGQVRVVGAVIDLGTGLVKFHEPAADVHASAGKVTTEIRGAL